MTRLLLLALALLVAGCEPPEKREFKTKVVTDSEGNQWLLESTDEFSRYYKVIPIKDTP